ncbi:MAG: nitroreductase family protein [Desulfatibacillaceae bacterium]|nr:nitroreductase family protein [Desulfatibacillaceae bacterium]
MTEKSPLFDTPVAGLVKARRSFRSYAQNPVEKEKLAALESFIQNLPPAPFGTPVRFALCDMGHNGPGRIPGTYGMIKGARWFLAGAAKNSHRDMEDFGWLFECIILRCTDLMLDTCWMGATINRGPFAQKLNLKPDETIPAVSPLGYRTKRRSLTDAVARMSVRATSRKPWQELFFDGGFDAPLAEESAGQWIAPLESVRLGPSATNRQPWRIVRNSNGVHFFLQRFPGYDKITKSADMQRIDMGIALCHFELVAREAGLPGQWETVAHGVDELLPRTEYVVSWVF